MNDIEVFKIAICGGNASGKSSLGLRLIDKNIPLEYNSTIGVDLLCKYYDNKKIKFHYWDIAGDKRFESITLSYISKVDLVIFTYSVHNYNSILRIKELYNTYKSIEWNTPALMVGTHIDINLKQSLHQTINESINKRFVHYGKQFATEKGIPHFLVSNITKKGIKELEETIMDLLAPRNKVVIHNDNKNIYNMESYTEKLKQLCIIL